MAGKPRHDLLEARVGETQEGRDLPGVYEAMDLVLVEGVTSKAAVMRSSAMRAAAVARRSARNSSRVVPSPIILGGPVQVRPLPVCDVRGLHERD